MANRSNPSQDNSQEISNYCPSKDIRTFVQALLSEEVRGNETKAALESGVPAHRYRWLCDERCKKYAAFKKWYDEQCVASLGKLRVRIDYALAREALKGIVPAIRTYYELQGLIKNQTTVNQTVVNKVERNGIPDNNIEATLARIDASRARTDRIRASLIPPSNAE